MMKKNLLLLLCLLVSFDLMAQAPDSDLMHIKFANGDSVTYYVNDIVDISFTITQGDAPIDTVYQNSAIRVTKNICYQVGNSDAWKLNIAVPVKEIYGKRPAIMIIHGDRFFDGSKDDKAYESLMLDYAAQGYVAVAVDYRLFREERIPACIYDVKCAIRWMKAHAEKYNINPDKIGVYGHSAGGALALMLALTDNKTELEGEGPYMEQSSSVACAAASAPRVEWGAASAVIANDEWWPKGHVKSVSPPLLILQGASDNVSKSEWTDNFVNALRNAGNKNVEYYKLSTAHDIALKTELELSRVSMQEFFNRNLGLNDPKMRIDQIKWIDNGGGGKYRSIAIKDRTLPNFTIYRPIDLEKAVEGEGAPLPVLIFGNGACVDSSIDYERMLIKIASGGYIVIAIGELVIKKGDREEKGSDSSLMGNAINWIVRQNALSTSAYYKKVATNKMATSGHSCGGAQAIANAANAHLKTYIIFNAGMGNMSMAGADKSSLSKLRGPILYLTGVKDDVAYDNACIDYNNITKVPVVHAYNPNIGHAGNYWEAQGGPFGKLALLWLDWQLKDKVSNAKIFLNGTSAAYPGCTFKSKNFPEE